VAKNTTIWLTCAHDDDHDDYVHFWQKKPLWRQNVYSCSLCKNDECVCDIPSLDRDCDEFQKVLALFGIPNGLVRRGQIIQLTSSVSISENKSSKAKVDELLKKMSGRSKQPTKAEILAVLKDISQEFEEDEDEDGI